MRNTIEIIKMSTIALTVSLIAGLMAGLLTGAICLGIIYSYDACIKNEKEANYQRLLSLPKSSNLLEVYYENQTAPIKIDKDIFRIGKYGITIEDKIYYFRGDTTIVDGEKRYITTFSSYGKPLLK